VFYNPALGDNTNKSGHVPDVQNYQGEIIISISAESHKRIGFEAVAEAYGKYRPNVEIKIELKGGTQASGLDYESWLNTQLLSGKPRPDLVSGNLVSSYRHYIDFENYREKINPYTGRKWEEDYDFVSYHQINITGSRIVMATQRISILWYYNKDVLEDFNLDLPNNWNEFMAACERVQEAGYLPVAMVFDYKFHQWLLDMIWDQYNRSSILYARAQPSDWNYDPEIDGKWFYNPEDPLNDLNTTYHYTRFLNAIKTDKINYDTPKFEQVLLSLKEIAQYAPQPFIIGGSIDPSQLYGMFLSGEAVFYLDNSYLLTQLDRDLRDLGETERGKGAFEWGTFYQPGQEHPLVEGPPRPVYTTSGEYISIIDKNQEQTDIVIDFLMFLLSAPGYQIFIDALEKAGQLEISGPLLVKELELPERYEGLFDSDVILGNAEGRVNRLVNLPPRGGALYHDIQHAIQDFIDDELSLGEASKRMDALMEASVDALRERSGLRPEHIQYPQLNPNE